MADIGNDSGWEWGRGKSYCCAIARSNFALRKKALKAVFRLSESSDSFHNL